MKKAITLFLIITGIGLISSQISSKEKQKIVVQKDTIKKNKITIDSKIAVVDTMIVEKLSFNSFKKVARASYYADKFNGKRTSSGAKFDNKKYTAAHRKLPFGTKLRVTNEANGKSVIVEVIDRGPFSRGREIDLSRIAFMEITANKNSGVMNVKIEVSK